MPKKKIELTLKMKENVNKALETVRMENNIETQAKLAELIEYSPERLSRAKNQTGISKGIADAIQKKFPDKNYPEDWLRGIKPYRTAGEAFKAEWETNAKSARDHHAIMCAVAEMMQYCGIEWDGNTTVQLTLTDAGLVPVNVNPVNVNGVDFYPWDLSLIADKVFEYLKLELRFAVMAKENEKIRNKPLQSSVVHIAKY